MDTTFRHHSLFILAENAVREAEQTRAAAYQAAETNPTRENIKRFMEADRAFDQAVKNREQVKGMKKFMHDTVEL